MLADLLCWFLQRNRPDAIHRKEKINIALKIDVLFLIKAYAKGFSFTEPLL